MSKYNYGASIPIESVPNQEFDQAIKEWSHYKPNMEKLIRTCLKKGIITNGCHPEVDPYLDFLLGNNIEEEKKLVSGIINVKNSQLLIMPDGINPFSGNNWDKAVVLVGAFLKEEDEVNNFIDTLTDSLNKEEVNNNFYFKALELGEYLRNKESRFDIRVLHNENDEYVFCLETVALTDKYCEYYKEFLNKTELTEKEEMPRHRQNYEFRSTDLNYMYQKVDKLTNYIKENFVVPKFENEEELDYNLIVRDKRREFGDTIEGKEAFSQWLQNEYDLFVGNLNKKRRV